MLLTISTPAQAAQLLPIWHPELRQPASVTDALSIASAKKNPIQAIAPPAGPMTLAASSGTRTCKTGWHYIQRDANSYVTGNCYGGWTMTVSGTRYENNTNWTYYSGNISGDYGGCGWMRSQDIGGASGSASSGCGARPNCDFIYCDGAGNPYTYGNAYDGFQTSVFPGCAEYANYRPWSSSGVPTNIVKYTTGGYNVLVRYLAKYSYGGHRYYMIRDLTTQAEANLANWVFIRDDCFSS